MCRIHSYILRFLTIIYLGAGDWPYPYPWGDRRFDLRCTAAGMTIVRLRYKRSWEERYSWESRLNIYVLANP